MVKTISPATSRVLFPFGQNLPCKCFITWPPWAARFHALKHDVLPWTRSDRRGQKLLTCSWSAWLWGGSSDIPRVSDWLALGPRVVKAKRTSCCESRKWVVSRISEGVHVISVWYNKSAVTGPQRMSTKFFQLLIHGHCQTDQISSLASNYYYLNRSSKARVAHSHDV